MKRSAEGEARRPRPEETQETNESRSARGVPSRNPYGDRSEPRENRGSDNRRILEGDRRRPYGDRSGGSRENRDRNRNDRDGNDSSSFTGHGRGRGDRGRERRDGNGDRSSNAEQFEHSAYRDDNRGDGNSGDQHRASASGTGQRAATATATAHISGANAVAVGVRGDPQARATETVERPIEDDQQGSRQGQGARRGQRRDPTAGLDSIRTRPEHITDRKAKQGTSGSPMNLVANYFAVETVPRWNLFNYRVDFKPEEERTFMKKVLLRAHATLLGGHIFDGATLWTAKRLNTEPMILTSRTNQQDQEVELTIKFVNELAPGDVAYLQVFNIIVRQWLQMLQFDEIGRQYYDRLAAIKMPNLRLELWPGYKTVIRHCENQLMLNVEVIHKVLRTDTCLDLINGYRLGGRDHEYRQKVAGEVIGSFVMTKYNRKTYKIDDIDWDTTPANTFEKKGTQVTFAEYTIRQYSEVTEIRDMRQPMLVSNPKKRDMHRGQTGKIYLIPELCYMTGLSDQMRSNFGMMRDVNKHLHTPPDKRMDTIQNFIWRVRQSPAITAKMESWGLELNTNLVKFDGRVMPKTSIIMRNARSAQDEPVTPDDRADWTFALRSKHMYSCEHLNKWVVLVPAQYMAGVDNLVQTMRRVGQSLGFQVQQPMSTHRLNDIRVPGYIEGINQVMANYKEEIKMIFIILPTNKLELYAAIKKRCSIDFGIPSQCFQSKHMNNPKGLMSIATKVVIQMNAKMGGQPWVAQNPLATIMVVGFDVHHCGKRKGPSVGAMVATTNKTLSRYYATVSFHENVADMSQNMAQDITKCVYAYRAQNNGTLPGRILFYRDGVSEGQLSHIVNTELDEIQKALKGIYANAELPKFTFIIVTKRINARIVTALPTNRPTPNYGNPPPGTVVDDVITLPERWDFYLISHHALQGTVSPTCYNIIHDEQGLGSDKLQIFTYKLTHMYYNWSGTVAVPALCQYAKKLAFLTGTALGRDANVNLSHLLHFL